MPLAALHSCARPAIERPPFTFRQVALAPCNSAIGAKEPPSAFRCIIDANGLRRADHTWGLTALRDRLPIPDVCLGISGLRDHDRGNRPEEPVGDRTRANP